MKELVQADGNTSAEEFRLEEFMPYRLSVASEVVSRLIAKQYLDHVGLGMSEWRLLAAVGRFTVLSPTAAGEKTAMDKVKVSRAAASLVARGLLRQSQDPDDGRGRLLRLTRKGASAYAGIPPMARDVEAVLAGGLTRSEWNSLHKVLSKLSDHVAGLTNGSAISDDS